MHFNNEKYNEYFFSRLSKRIIHFLHILSQKINLIVKILYLNSFIVKYKRSNNSESKIFRVRLVQNGFFHPDNNNFFNMLFLKIFTGIFHTLIHGDRHYLR